MEETEKVQMRKRNMKLFPTYKMLGWDYLFFYTINFLFLTQVKQINPADIVLIDSFYYIFSIAMQVPSTFIIEFLGRKKSLVLANILNCFYMIIILMSGNIMDLILAKMLNSLAFSIKGSVEPSLLNESIPPTRSKSKIFAKINQKGMSGYYILNAIFKVASGFLYETNPYIPILLSLGILVVVTVLSILFIEPTETKSKEKIKKVERRKEQKEGFKFVLKSERIKALILFAAIMTAILGILSNYQVALLEELNISASHLGILFAILGILTGMATRRQEKFHAKFRNKSLSVIGFGMTLSCLVAGIAAIISKQYIIGVIGIILAYGVNYICMGIYYPLLERYMSNFTNKKIDTKIFTVNNTIKSIFSAITGVIAAFLLDKVEIVTAMIVVGAIFTVLMILVTKYMKPRVGLKPEEYSKEEVKYDKIKEIV